MPGNYEDLTAASYQEDCRAFERRCEEYMSQVIANLERQAAFTPEQIQENLVTVDTLRMRREREEREAALARTQQFLESAHARLDSDLVVQLERSAHWFDEWSSLSRAARANWNTAPPAEEYSEVKHYWKSVHGTEPVNEDVATRFKAYASKEAKIRRAA
jgi:hypothetical protein